MFSSGYQLALENLCATKFYRLYNLDDKLGRHGSVVIVISPLVSLMVDQVQSLRQRSVNAAIMSSGNVDKELMVTDEDFSRCSLLFCAAEALEVSKWREAISKHDFLSRVVAVVDEAHCVSKW